MVSPRGGHSDSSAAPGPQFYPGSIADEVRVVMSDPQKHSPEEEMARSLSWKLFLIVSAAAAAFAGAVYFFVL